MLDGQESDLDCLLYGVFAKVDGVFFIDKGKFFFFGEQDSALCFDDVGGCVFSVGF